ncbi:transposase [Salinimonas sediminis]|uniref:Transposase n=1 Tax=Salinimonas sediminis TaxID=2303538 RepID=A0A346NMQ0_9ALTE|nr:transposase [Salinimonas sediminis]AXR06807.1 transposase [Salinimonas sediminis]
MPRPRKELICVEQTPYYHCVSRCVRRACLCGKDSFTGKSYEHRRGWVERRLYFLARVFAIDLCAYAVMSNHTHVVLRVATERAQQWSNKHVLRQWHKLHRGTRLTQLYAQGATLSQAERATVNACVSVYRQRLQSISWFMRELNEYIARQANKEDDCTGRFWEGRFKSQALLDEAALLSCMVYVDLNPLRAGMVIAPEDARFTSIAARIRAFKTRRQPPRLMPFIPPTGISNSLHLPLSTTDYITLVDYTGRCIAANKKGVIPASLPPILERIHVDQAHWLSVTHKFEQHFRGAASILTMKNAV